MSSDLQFIKETLLQVQEEQVQQGKMLAELRGNMLARVESLESSNRWHRVMTYVVNPALALASGIAAAIGLKLKP